MKIQLLNKIAAVGLAQLGDAYTVGETVENPDGILVRSAAMHEMEFGSELKAIARAGAGVNNIPIDRCTEQGIVVFNTPGANANGVKELALCALLLASRDIVGGIAWAKTLDADVAKQVLRTSRVTARLAVCAHPSTMQCPTKALRLWLRS